MKRGLRGIVIAGVVSAALLIAGPASASCGHKTKKSDPAIAQYVEVIPTSCGSQPSSQGGGTVPANIARRITKGPGSRPGKVLLLHVVATRPPRLRLRGADLRGADRLLNASGRNPLGAAVGGVATNGSVVALVVVMAAFAVLAICGVLYRRRMTR